MNNNFYKMNKEELILFLDASSSVQLKKQDKTWSGMETFRDYLINAFFSYRKWYDIEQLSHLPDNILADCILGRISNSNKKYFIDFDEFDYTIDYSYYFKKINKIIKNDENKKILRFKCSFKTGLEILSSDYEYDRELLEKYLSGFTFEKLCYRDKPSELTLYEYNTLVKGEK